MAKPPGRKRTIPRIAEIAEPAVTGRRLVPKPADPRQAELFAPVYVQPMLATAREGVPTGLRWQYEIKFDGYRVQAHVRDGRVAIFTRGGFDWTDRMPGIAAALTGLPCSSAVLDGEAIMEDERGASDFFAVHKALRGGSAPDAVMVAFDLLELDGPDLREWPLRERRAVLAELLVSASDGLALSPNIDDDGQAMLDKACEMGLEGIVAKRVDRPYRSGKSEDWVKVRCTHRDHFAVIGFEPEGSRGVSALKIARLVDDKLVPCGSVGSGIGREASAALRQALDAGKHIIAEVTHRGITPAGELRHPAFKGWEAGL